LLFGGVDFFHNFPTDYLGVKFHGFVEILGARGKRPDSFDVEHGNLLESKTIG
jgi:hypothetical protein